MSDDIGAVFEIKLAHGFAYAQVIRVHEAYGDILAVDTQRYDISVSDLRKLEFDKTVIFPLVVAAKAKQLDAKRVCHSKKENNAKYSFKFAVRDKDGCPLYWWLWDGESITIADPDQDLSQKPERMVLSRTQFLDLWSGSMR